MNNVIDLYAKFSAVEVLSADRISETDKLFCEKNQAAYEAALTSYQELVFFWRDIQVKQGFRLNAMNVTALSRRCRQRRRHERDGNVVWTTANGGLAYATPVPRVKGDTVGMAWVASSTAVTICRYALHLSGPV